MKVAEMWIRWMCGLTRLNRIRNAFIKRNLDVTNIVGRIRKNVLRWFGLSERGNNKNIVKKIDEIGLKANRERGRLKEEMDGNDWV